MSRYPSEYPQSYVRDILQEVYYPSPNTFPEQSAIYHNIRFSAISEVALGIILTAQCDIEDFTDESYVVLARLAPLEEIFNYILVTKYKYSDSEANGEILVHTSKVQPKNALKEFTKNYVKNNTFKYHFLPALPNSFGPSFVCFEITQCVRFKELTSEDKVCVLRSPFRESLPSRFASYIGRIGTPAFKDDDLRSSLERACKAKPSA